MSKEEFQFFLNQKHLQKQYGFLQRFYHKSLAENDEDLTVQLKYSKGCCFFFF